MDRYTVEVELILCPQTPKATAPLPITVRLTAPARMRLLEGQSRSRRPVGAHARPWTLCNHHRPPIAVVVGEIQDRSVPDFHQLAASQHPALMVVSYLDRVAGNVQIGEGKNIVRAFELEI